MGTTDSKEIVKNDPRFEDSESQQNVHAPGPSRQSPEEEKSYMKSKPNHELDEETKYSQYETPGKFQSKRNQVFTGMTRRVLKNKEKYSSSKEKAHMSKIQGSYGQYKNVDTDGIEWVKKEEIIDTRLISSKPHGSRAPKGKFSGTGSSNRTWKARSGVTINLPPKALATILSYDMASYRKYMSVCADWHVTIKEALDQHFNRVETEFVLKYYQNLLFTESFTSSSEIKFCGKRGIRIDRVMVCDILNLKDHLNKTLTIGYTFSYYGEPKEKKFKAEYRIDVCKKRNRMVWMHVDRETGCTYQQTIFQSCPEDKIEFALSFYSLRGLVDVDSIEWNDPQISKTPKTNTLSYNKDMMEIATDDRAIKIYADINRVCELEDTVVEWYEQKYYEYKSEIVDFSFLQDLFQINCVEYSGVDNKVVRLHTKAMKEGSLPFAHFGLGVIIKNQKDIIRNEVKRKGILSEREKDIELRVGDEFIIYITKAKSSEK
ncbi:unnamed protein product [Moneuplotes crassus]|uniref:Uncharacterized protein n=1 Tax=Euplotes crassus TaxID=5936 RepID=A0AAD1UI63_EUPCR|nr:unnamed protein product [Moneuplotes crassus]